MHTTITLDKDVARKAKDATVRLGQPFQQVINEALRAGLETLNKPTRVRPYKTRARKLGVRRGIDLSNVGELLSNSENSDLPPANGYIR